MRNKDWSLRTLHEEQIFSESNISTKLFESRDWLIYKNAKIVFNFHQILSETSCIYISFTVVKRHNPSRAWKPAVEEHEPSQEPVAHSALMLGWGELWCIVKKHCWCDAASYIWRMFLFSPISCACTCRWLGLPCGQDICAAVVVSYCLIIFLTFPHFLTSLNTPAEHKFPGKWQCW